jgi:uncharacterized protein (DUF1501 family)
MSFVTRRDFFQSIGLTSVGIAMPRFLLAKAETDARFVFVILRGALDGLAAVPPYGDGNYTSKRGELALSIAGGDAGALQLNELFALHASLRNLHAWYEANELAVIHAVASPYRERSHFDGQDLLENGTLKPHGANDGWLNRALAAIPAAQGRAAEKFALAFAQNVPLVLRGDARVGSWAPSRMPDTDADTLQRIAEMYAGNDYFSSRLEAAISADAMAVESGSKKEGMDATTVRRDPLGALTTIAAAAGRMMKPSDGARIAVIETTGWDTHANQGAERGLLATRLAALDTALGALHSELGETWKQTVVLIATEFGRTVAVNGTRGTDHGTGTCAFVAGGAVKGGRVLADWPGLANSNLYQGRDLNPTLDLRSVCKGILIEHLGLSAAHVETKVFPDSRAAKPLVGLVRNT